MRRRIITIALFTAGLSHAFCPRLVAQTEVKGRLTTRWTNSVDPEHVLPEYPRPQLTRRSWVNLNGRWDYCVTAKDAPVPTSFGGTILVPFPIESFLSGVQRAVTEKDRLWYHRTFRAPPRKPGWRLLLHFGAVDWRTTVFVNGVRVGEHEGGYDPFTIDITDALESAPQQSITVGVWDPTDKGPQPRGKQVLGPKSIWYTAVTGIWQTVWLEPVPPIRIDRLEVTPNLDSSTVVVRVGVTGADSTVTFTATTSDMKHRIVEGRGVNSQPLTLRLGSVRPWSPSDPYLYRLQVRLSSGDTVGSYFGMRKIALGRDRNGTLRLFLNNAPLFQYGMLDQGWWPDGLYTAPMDAALRYDLETMKRLGFNLVRKHVKVEPDRWYYHADRLGMLVWQDMPSGDNNTEAGKAVFAEELGHLVDALGNHPSIVTWVPFNEEWGQHDTECYVVWLKNRDPSRLVNNASGWVDKGVGDMSDIHAYPGPGIPVPDDKRALVLGEFGGLGLPIAGHTWVDQNNWGYRTFTSRQAVGEAYAELQRQLRFMIADGLSAAIYTQTTDVEIEVNGLMTYDRAIVKLPPTVLRLHRGLYGPSPNLAPIVPSSWRDGQLWRVTETAPPNNWFQSDYDDSGWRSALGGFGTKDTPGSIVRTPWNTHDLWLRRQFELPSRALQHPHFRIHHDDDADVYLNGTLVAKLPGYTVGYTRIPLDMKARSLLRPGTNTLAIHVHQNEGGQYIDAGIDEVRDR